MDPPSNSNALRKTLWAGQNIRVRKILIWKHKYGFWVEQCEVPNIRASTKHKNVINYLCDCVPPWPLLNIRVPCEFSCHSEYRRRVVQNSQYLKYSLVFSKTKNFQPEGPNPSFLQSLIHNNFSIRSELIESVVPPYTFPVKLKVTYFQ